MNALAHLASLLDLDDADVDELTKAILAAENRQLGAVQADIGTVMNLTGEQVWADLRSANRFPPALDALFDFLRSRRPPSRGSSRICRPWASSHPTFSPGPATRAASATVSCASLP